MTSPGDILTYGIYLVAVAVISGLIGPLALAWYTARERRRERQEDKDDRALVAAAAEKAAKNAEMAAQKLTETAEATTDTLAEISTTGKATHNLVNNDRSIDKTYIAKLTRLVAKLLPDDIDAQSAAVEAQKEADRLPKPIRKS